MIRRDVYSDASSFGIWNRLNGREKYTKQVSNSDGNSKIDSVAVCYLFEDRLNSVLLLCVRPFRNNRDHKYCTSFDLICFGVRYEDRP